MEDEDVDSVNKFGAIIEKNNVGESLAINNDVCSEKNSSEEKSESTQEDTAASIDRLKSALVNHDTLSVDRLKDSEEDRFDSGLSSPKKLNGEVDKSEVNITTAEESSEDNTKNKHACLEEDDSKEEEKKEEEKEEPESNNDSKESTKRKRSVSEHSNISNGSENESDGESSSNSSPVEFRGFKKRKLSESGSVKLLNAFEDNEQMETGNCDAIIEIEKPKSVELRRSARNASGSKKYGSNETVINIERKEGSGDQLTEYAQYLGLQPTVKFKCGRCGEKHFQSMASLNAHQMICCKTASNVLSKQTKPTSDSNLSTNFRITRKVYLCSACGTYYENWKLFLHMRDMHKRHICLFCLGMFSVAERLAEHLLYQHNVHEKTCKSPEEFLNLFKGSCYLTCCSCEKMFTERDDFYDHQCKDSVAVHDAVSLTPKEIKELAQKCTLCGVKCGHFRTCPKVAHKFQHNAAQPPAPTTNVNTQSNNSSNISLEKYYVPVPTNVQNNWPTNNLNQDILKQALSVTHSEKDYYDVSSAARFCHVDIANDSDNQHSPDKAMLEKLKTDTKTCPESDTSKSPNVLETTSSKEQEEPIDNNESLPNNSNNIILNSVSDESDHSENRLDSKDCETKNESPKKPVENTDKDSVESNELSTGEDVDTVSTSLEKNSERLDEVKNSENEINTEKEVNEVEDMESTSEFNESLQCFVKLDRLKEENSLVNCLDSNKEEENSQHNSSSDSSSSSSTNSNNSRRNSLDSDHNDLTQDNVTCNESVTDTEKDEGNKKEAHTDDVSINEEEPIDKTIDDNSLNFEEKSSSLSNAESIDNRFENNNETTEKSDGSDSEESDKLSVVMDDEEQKEKTDNDEDEACEDIPIGKDTDKDESIENHMETEATTELNDAEDRDTCSDDDTVQKVDSENDASMEESQNVSPPKQSSFQCDGVNIQLASEEVTAMALMLDDKMDSLSSQSIVKECVRTSCTTCSYCSHAIKIGVNGKQLAIHLLTEHRYMPVKNETVDHIIERLKRSLDELEDVWFNTDSYDSSDKGCFVPYDHTYECFQCNYVANTHKDLFSHKRKVHQKTILYCSMCKENFYSYSELLCHMCPGLYDASKDIQFRCCMCASDRLPSAFRLMVHLRKSHHTCDICLEIVEDQQKLSTHMVKHKLHHLCYRCGIAYRNKPDITKHLFWKHGTESVLCKKCLQKKWPHVYHFCIPPNSFVCEECNLSFSKAVYLKVHKRFHNNNLPYTCTTCEQKFVSKKLLNKHEKVHEVISVEENVNNDSMLYKSGDPEKDTEQNNLKSGELQISTPAETLSPDKHAEATEKSGDTVVKPHKKKSKKDKDRKLKPVVDVYDLPPLNLSSESDDTEDEKETRSVVTTNNDDEKAKESTIPTEELKTSELLNDESKMKVNLPDGDSEPKTSDLNSSELAMDTEENTPITVVDGIWDNFHTYKAEQEKRENLDIANKQSILSQLDPALPTVLPKDTVLGDHDYCLPNNSEEKGHAEETEEISSKTKSNEHSSSIDHDYCTQKSDSLENSNINTSTNLLSTSNQSEATETPPKRKQKSPKKKIKQHNNSSSSSDSSSDSDSSSCSCGTNCSCTSSSSNSSSSSSSDSDSSSSDGKNNHSGMSTSKREKKKERLKAKRKGEIQKAAEPLPPTEEQPISVQVPVEPEELLIKESDLETDETATDEEFYDQYPQMQANQILAEKRNQLMLLASVAPTVNNGTASPPVPNTSSGTNINLDPISSPKLEIVAPPVTITQPQTQSKKRVKAKKRRKSSSLSMSKSRKNASYDTPQPSTSFSSQWHSTGHGKKAVNEVSPMYLQSSVLPNASLKSDDHMLVSSPVISHRSQSHHHSASSSETNSSKRFSKRRRVRNKFYGYSSDEDGEHNQTHPPAKWKKFSPVDGKQSVHQQQFYTQPLQVANTLHPEYNHGYQQQLTPAPPPPKAVQPVIRTAYDENQINNNLITKRTAAPVPLSSGTSSDSDADSDSDTSRLAINQQTNATSINVAGLNVGATEKDDKLYCYCQCPYDEVSEMIACDGIDCAIEWFHFECVGIMVPPKGKWYCPDCRKRRGLS